MDFPKSFQSEFVCKKAYGTRYVEFLFIIQTTSHYQSVRVEKGLFYWSTIVYTTTINIHGVLSEKHAKNNLSSTIIDTQVIVMLI